MGDENVATITKESLINIISDKCEDDFISTKDLLTIIDRATDIKGNISKKRLIKSIRSSHTKTVVKNVYSILENLIFEYLSGVNKKQDVCIKLFEGISLDARYIPEKTKKNNLTGETNFVKSKIKPKFNITRSYIEKLNDK